ncbi:MAG: beta-galactosidase [Actinomycetota bacterium]
MVSSLVKLYPRLLVDQEFTTLENIGLSWLRCDFAWHHLEPVEGGWDFSGTDLVLQEAVDRGISILGILGASPSWANGGNEWNYPPTDMEAWRNYVRTVAIRYGE